MFGSVLCSPGCFSVYRATALRDVLKTYATEIDSAMDFLTKDMGNALDFTTLLIKIDRHGHYLNSAGCHIQVAFSKVGTLENLKCPFPQVVHFIDIAVSECRFAKTIAFELFLTLKRQFLKKITAVSFHSAVFRVKNRYFLIFCALSVTGKITNVLSDH